MQQDMWAFSQSKAFEWCLVCVLARACCDAAIEAPKGAHNLDHSGQAALGIYSSLAASC
jgi:hypothetical protein